MKVTQFVRLFAIAALAIGSLGATASAATIIVSDNFESYATTADVAAVYNAQATPAGSLSPNGNTGNALEHPGGNVMARTFAGISPTALNPIVWEFDFFDDGLNPGTGKRITGGLRNTSGSVVLEMGRFNSVANPPGANISGYGIRVSGAGESQTSGGADDVDWITFSPNPALTQGWHHVRATITPASILFQLDMGANGSVDASRTIFTSTGATEIYNNVRFGGPSNNSSPAGAIMRFDNLSVRVIPEPAALALAGMGVMGLVAVARRRNG